MGSQKIINLWQNTPNQPTKFRSKKLFEINDESRGTYNTSIQINLRSRLRSSLCDYSDADILAEVGAGGVNNRIQVMFKNSAQFTNCISKINNTQIDNAEDIDVVMPMYNLIEDSNDYSKTSGRLCQ